jgi:hypothetical protein
MVASATIHELLLFIFESVKLKKLNFWSIFMQWLKTCLKLSLMRVFDMPTKNQHLSVISLKQLLIYCKKVFKG